MAASIAFGILFSTVITLFLVPSLYIIGADIRRQLSRLRNLYRSNPESTQTT